MNSLLNKIQKVGKFEIFFKETFLKSGIRLFSSTILKSQQENKIFEKNRPEYKTENLNDSSKKVQNISRAMAYYMEKMRERDQLMMFKKEEYEIGKQHLARIIGEDPENIDQQKINVSLYNF